MHTRAMRAVTAPMAAAALIAAMMTPLAGTAAAGQVNASQQITEQSTTQGTVTAFGSAARVGPAVGASSASRPVGIQATPSGHGYWLVAGDGGIFPFGDARFHGSAGGIQLAQPVVGMATTPTGQGYWLVASDGGIFAFGDARFFGSTGGIHLAAPIVGMAPTATGRGYWLVASDGGLFAFGDARFHGSAGGTALAQPVVGMAASKDGGGYWLVTRDGRVLHYGDATYYGSVSHVPSSHPVIGIAPAAGGYWVAQRSPYSTPFTPDLISYLQTLPETTTAAVEDLNTGVLYTYNPGPSLILGSTVKVEILGTLLSEAEAAGRWLTPTEIDLATRMIEVSDNSAGQALFDEVGGAAPIQAWDNSVGMVGTYVYPSWGVSTSTATDELTLLNVYNAPNRFLSEPYRQFGLYLLDHVELSQIFGINVGPPESTVLAAKTGRMPGFGASNAIGWIDGDGRDYVIAVLTQGGPSDQSDVAAEAVVSWDAWKTLGP